MNKVYIKITAGPYCCDRLLVNKASVTTNQPSNNVKTQKFGAHLNAIVVHCLIKELKQCEQCRTLFINYFFKTPPSVYNEDSKRVIIQLEPFEKCPETIDHNWNNKVSLLLRERCELDHTLSWLSTLGGAFSALGDYFDNCAETAAKISIHQFQLALRLGDPGIAARCRLYFSLSLIQRKHFKLAQSIIAHEYEIGKLQTCSDERLLRMCKGIWSKLKYEWNLHKLRNKKKKIMS